MDLGPQDHGWCAGYSCQRRLSLFHSIVALNKSYEVYFTGTSPQNLRLMLLNVKHDKVRQDGNNCLRVIGVNYLLIFLSAKDFISSPVLLNIVSHSSFSRIIRALPRILLAQTVFISLRAHMNTKHLSPICTWFIYEAWHCGLWSGWLRRKPEFLHKNSAHPNWSLELYIYSTMLLLFICVRNTPLDFTLGSQHII